MADSTRDDAAREASEASDPRRAGVGGAGVGLDQATSSGVARPADLTGGDEVTGPGADAGVTSGSRATATGANLGETEAIADQPGGGPGPRQGTATP